LLSGRSAFSSNHGFKPAESTTKIKKHGTEKTLKDQIAAKILARSKFMIVARRDMCAPTPEVAVKYLLLRNSPVPAV